MRRGDSEGAGRRKGPGVGFLVVGLCLMTSVATSAAAQASVAAQHRASARVSAMASVRDATPLRPATDSSAILSGSLTAVSNAAFGLEVLVDQASAPVVAVRITGGPWIPVEPGRWIAVTDRPPGRHALVLEYRVEAPPGAEVPAAGYRAITR